MSIGAQLRASREARGLSLDAVARATRVQPRILAAIERDDVGAVPPRPFGRGFVKAYAAEMGLDPERVTHDYFARFAPPPAAEVAVASVPAVPQARPHTWVYAVGVIGLAVGVALAFLARRPEPEPPPPSTLPAIGTSGAAAPSAASEAAPSVTAAPLDVVLSAQRPAWVTATADGRREVYRILTPGAPTHLTGSQVITIRVGDAGAIMWRVNGRDFGLMGRSGQVRDVRLTADTVGALR